MDETIGKLFDGYSDTFCHADDVGKLKVDEAYTLGLNGCQNLFTFGLILLLCHSYISCFVSSIGKEHYNRLSIFLFGSFTITGAVHFFAPRREVVEYRKKA